MMRRARLRRRAERSALGDAAFLVRDDAGMGRWCIHRVPRPVLIRSFHRVVVVDPSPLPVDPGAGNGVSGALNGAPHATVRGALPSGPDQRRQTGDMRGGHRGPGQRIIPRVVAVPVAEEAPVKVVLNGGENANTGP